MDNFFERDPRAVLAILRREAGEILHPDAPDVLVFTMWKNTDLMYKAFHECQTLQQVLQEVYAYTTDALTCGDNYTSRAVLGLLTNALGELTNQIKENEPYSSWRNDFLSSFGKELDDRLKSFFGPDYRARADRHLATLPQDHPFRT